MSDVNDHRLHKQHFDKPIPKYTADREMLRGVLKCPNCGEKIRVRVTLKTKDEHFRY